MNRPAVLLPGASGQIGIFAIPLLVAAQFRVMAISRNNKPAWYPDLIGVNWLKPEALSAEALDSVHCMLSCGPLGFATSLVQRCTHLRRIVVFSTTSVYSKQDSGDQKEREQISSILGEEKELKSECSQRDMALSILRPTLVYGCGMDRNVSFLAHWIERFGIVPLAAGAPGLRQPVHAHDLAQAAVMALSHESPLSLDTPLCGGSTMSYREMVRIIFTALGRSPRMVSLPKGLMIMLTTLAGLMPGLHGIRPEMVRRQSRDLVFDDSQGRAILSHAPRRFSPSREDFSLPRAEALLALAGKSADC